ncbi:MAG: thioredoxin domain-containing protein [Bifidobacteriaceae bacterium]|jgi:protein-disulfide isomerase|nr:thioredoxin domain-containing protein [Bifidobacteriaceae bacterium]
MAKAKRKPPQVVAREQARQAARLEAERLKAAQAAKDRRRKLIGLGIGVVLLVAIVVVVILVLQETKQSTEDVIRPTGGNDAGAIVIGQDLAAGGEPASGEDVVTVRIFSDYMCPYCGQAERRLKARLEELATAGEIRLELQVLPRLDSLSLGTEYSTRAANAAATVANYAPAQYLAFHSKLFESGIQPAEGSEGLSDEELIALAQEVGVPEDVTARFAAAEFEPWVSYANTEAYNQGVSSTPAMLIGLKESDLAAVSNPVQVDIDDAIAKVRAGEKLS